VKKINPNNTIKNNAKLTITCVFDPAAHLPVFLQNEIHVEYNLQTPLSSVISVPEEESPYSYARDLQLLSYYIKTYIPLNLFLVYLKESLGFDSLCFTTFIN